MISDTARTLASALVIMALIVAGLVYGKDILIPLALSAILAFILAPPAAWLTARGIPHGAAIGGIVLLVFTLFISAAVGFSAQMLSVTTTLEANKQNLVTKMRTFTGKDAQDGLLGRAAKSVEALEKTITKELESDSQPGKSQPAVVVADGRDSSPARSLKDIVSAVSGPLATLLVTILFTSFLLLQNHDLRDRIVRILGTDNMSGTIAALSEAGSRLGQLFLGQAVLNGGFGAFIGCALWLAGVPNAFLWGFCTALLRFIPYIGAFLSALPPLLLAAAVDPSWTSFLLTAAIFLISEPIMGHVIEPLVLGKRVGLSPFAMVAAASFWTLVWGPVGLLLSAPLTMVLVVIGENIPQLNFLAVLLGDKPALDPVLQFYHRLLSNDVASAVDTIAEEPTKGSVPAISDSIVLPALRLAALDQRRGRITQEQQDDLRETMEGVIDAIPIPSDANTSAEKKRQRVILVPARGPIDVIAGEYIAATLNRMGMAEPMALQEASGIMALSSLHDEFQGATPVIVLSTVGGMDSAHMRVFSKRARKEFPQAQIFSGNWATEHDDKAMSSPTLDDHSVPQCQSIGELCSLLRMQSLTDSLIPLSADEKPGQKTALALG